MRRYLARRSFGLVLALLAVGTVVGVGAVVILHRVTLVPVVIGVAVAIGIVYIVAFARPEPEPPPSATGPPSPTSTASASAFPPTTFDLPAPMMEPSEPYEPSYDPVEEADRLDSEKARSEPPASEGQDPK
jgi:hypothetical protein